MQVEQRLASLLPKTVVEWATLLEAALAPPIESVWYPDHFFLYQRSTGMRYSPQKYPHPPNSESRSAVLLLLSPVPAVDTEVGFQDMCITLTKRTQTLSTHKGQMSFPGGRIDPGESTWEAAQRETQEEVGLLSSEYTAIGSMTPIDSNMAGSLVTPHVAIATQPVHPTCASPTEVASIHYLHMSNLLLRASHTHSRVIKHRSFRSNCPSYFPCFFASDSQDTPSAPVVCSTSASPLPEDNGFSPLLAEEFPGELVWGLTSFVICELLARVAGALEVQQRQQGVQEGEVVTAAQVLRCTNVLGRDPEGAPIVTTT